MALIDEKQMVGKVWSEVNGFNCWCRPFDGLRDLGFYLIVNGSLNCTGVIVTADQGSYTFMETSETVDAINGNMLSGSTTEIETSSITNGTVYTLGHGTNDELGFFRYKGATLGAYKAFLVVANSEVNAFSLVFSNEDASAIIGIENYEKNMVVYDLQGRRAERPNKGIYIVNGKKVLFKK